MTHPTQSDNRKFFSGEFVVEFQGITGTFKGLISEHGITRIFTPSDMNPVFKLAIGQTVNVRLDPLVIKGIFLQQIIEHGSFFEIRFRDLLLPQINYLKQRITTEGITPGWTRAFPRINVDGAYEDLPVANLCMIRFAGQNVFVNVQNFTLGGIRVETNGDSLAELRVGARIQFDMFTSRGDVLTNLQADVKNIASQETTFDGIKINTRSFGLKFIAMDPANDKKYKELIKDYCVALMKKFHE